ncbi:MAG: hypothetical protein IKJ06_03110, partial [Clostridia bacterium]|nr:hypothetical protein [Clostridia bacterium]
LFDINPLLRLYGNDTLLTGAVTFFALPPKETTSKFQPLYRMYRLSKWNSCRSIAFRDVKPEQNIYSPQNILNGYTRPYGTPNIWISQTNKEEWVNVSFDTPKKIGDIELIFNTMLEEDNMPDKLPQLVKMYDLEIEREDGEIVYLPDIKNHHRVACHSLNLEDVTSIKINFKENNGSPFFELYGVRFK